MSVDVLTFGCRLNAYESEVMRGLAARADDTVIVNTCAVTTEAERQARQTIRRISRERPGAKIVVTGCAVQINPAAWASLPNVARVVGNVEKMQSETWTGDGGSLVSDISAARETSAHLVTEFTHRARAFIQVQQGCDHRCTFCIIPFGRGPNRSVPIGLISEQIKALVVQGYQEVVLTGVDITSFGSDLPGKPTLGQMVRRVLAAVPDLPRLRLSSIDPAAIDDDLWRLLADEPRLMPHLHLSLQAGSDIVLKRMRRRHLRAQALDIIRKARSLRPGIAIGADLIAGFPTESDAAFEETLHFVKEAAIPFLHVFPYSERPGTPAARMPQVPKTVRKERATALRQEGELQTSAFLKTMIGSTVSLLTETDDIGHSEHFAVASLLSSSTPNRLIKAFVRDVRGAMLVAEAV
ncbi:MAG TPA: tRNA (N(6)-L-threonylcarbamoyladenosine(37)-C(2))-methylthiotransferase MtaB [Rhodopila sp.]|nr:tRNA (N(6)-L-threonylcarbamoyladenosine(37)-C(2))-methylthiotransferase MtaB [Rhodopila sp.]